ncbi:MAG: glycoside hydrolase family 36 protein [Dehalococcoidia bacterium]
MSSTGGFPWGLEFEAPDQLQVSFDPLTQTLSAELTNTSDAPWRPGQITARAQPDLGAGGGSLWLSGDSMHAPSSVHTFGDDVPRASRQAGDGPVQFHGDGMAVLTAAVRAPASLLFGALAGDRFRLHLSFSLDPEQSRIREIAVGWQLEGAELKSGQTVELPPVLIVEGQDPWELARDYARRVADLAGGPRQTRSLPIGWCSWYELGSRVTADDTRRNLSALRKAGLSNGVVQVDDGYQSAVGDWLETSDTFGARMPALASEIREAGLTPGIWLAPLLLHERSQTLRDRPELALQDADGRPLLVDLWLGRCAVLDVSRGPGREWLADTIRTVVHDWGFEYLKLDGLQFAAQPSSEVRYATDEVTGPAHLRLALQTIRRAAGASTFILGCTSEFMPAIGLVDAMRVGPDVAPVWLAEGRPSLRVAAATALLRGWMHGNWWINDPDCLITRTAPGGLSPHEVRLLASAIAVSGGSVLLGDDVDQLPPENLECAYPLLPPTGVAARPTDLTEGPVPSVWRASLGSERGLLGVFNWSEQPRWIGVSELLAPGEIAFDIWRKEMLGRGDIRLEPHEGTLWQTALPGEAPRAVGDSGHVAFASLFERRVSGRLQLRNDAARSRTVAVEARGRITVDELSPGEMSWFD